ncbi:SGNH/GDSL hydrolase family protein [Subtercola sp. YIM 133946]|uniref:SGNH/GDSL hydrolase family protein n=1 Tax=Subtercola sp. YIM 133946 TaxID=3118909 RepID=UPI002F94B337
MTTARPRRAQTFRRFGGAAAIVSAVALATFVSVPAAMAASAAPAAAALPTAGLNYVAIGDSYSSGLGVDPQTDQPVAGCGQSSNNYPHQVAAALGMNLTDVTCAGAQASNVTTDPQQTYNPDGTPLAVAPVQLDSLSADTDVVTITVGGNGLKFTQIALACAAATADGPLLFNNPPAPAPPNTTCEPSVSALLTPAFQALAKSLADTYAAVAQAAPNAKIFVLGYPSIAPDVIPPAGCFSSVLTPNSFPFTTADTPFLHGVETNLDNLVQKTAAGAGFTYVPTFADSIGHSACAAPADQYVNGVFVSFVTDPTTHETVPLIDEKSLHPNASGVDFMAAELEPQIEAAFPVIDTPTPTPTPSVTATPTVSPTDTPAPTSSATATAVPAALASTGLSEPFIAGAGVLALLFLGAGISVAIVQRRLAAGRR